MRKPRILSIVVLLSVVISLSRAGLWAQEANRGKTTNYKIKDLGTLPMGANSFPLWLTNSGEVVGYADIGRTDSLGNSIVHAFLWKDGRIEDLGTLGGNNSNASSANDRGAAVGTADLMGGATSHGILWTGRSMTDLGTLVGPDGYSSAASINDRGSIVGFSTTMDGSSHAVLWAPGVITDLGTLGGANSFASGINERGQITGASQVNVITDPHLGFPPFYAVLWNDGMMMNLGLGPAGGIGAAAASINNRTQVVGRFALPDAMVGAIGHAFLWERGVMLDLGVPTGDQDSEALGLNDRGQIVGDSFMGFIESPSMSGRALLWEGKEPMPIDLNTRIATNSGYFLISAPAVNDRGQIVVCAIPQGTMNIHAALLTPEDSDASLGTPRAAIAETAISKAAPRISDNANRLLRIGRTKKLGHGDKMQ